MHGRKEVVLLVVEHIVIYGHAGRDKFGDAALDKFLGCLGVFELLADGYALARPDKFGQIGVERVMWKAGKFDILCRSVGTTGQRNAEYFGRGYGIL